MVRLAHVTGKHKAMHCIVSIMFIFSQTINSGRTVYAFERILEIADSLELRGFKGAPVSAALVAESVNDAEPLSTVLLRIVQAHVKGLEAKANGKPILLPVPGLNEANGKLSRREADAGTVLARLTHMADEDSAGAMVGDAILYGGNTRAMASLYRLACGLSSIDIPCEVSEFETIKEVQEASLLDNRQGKASDTRAILAYLLQQVPRLTRPQVCADIGCTQGKGQEYVAAAASFTRWPGLFEAFGGTTFNYRTHNAAKEAANENDARIIYESKSPERLNVKDVLTKLESVLKDSPLKSLLVKVLDKDTNGETDLSPLIRATVDWHNAK